MDKFNNYSKEDLSKTGVYKITLNNKNYVGSTSKLTFYNRWMIHLKDLKRNKHHSSYLQNAVNKYSIDKLKFEIIEFVEPTKCIEREQYWIDTLNSYEKGYNSIPTAGSRLGSILSEKTKEKIRNTLVEKGKTEFKKLHKFIKVYDFQFNYIAKFDNVQECSEILNIKNDTIRAAIHNQPRIVNNNYYILTADFDINNNMDKILNNISRTKLLKKINQFDVNGNFIKTWDSLKEATEITNTTSILDNLKNRCNSAGGFVWKYYKEPDNKMIFIKGNVPSLKNSKQWIPKIKKLIPSKTVQKYYKNYEYQFDELKDNFLSLIKNKNIPIIIEVHFVRDSKRKFDFINACQIIFDLMVKHGWLEDDDMNNLIPFPLQLRSNKWFSYNKENSGVWLKIK